MISIFASLVLGFLERADNAAQWLVKPLLRKAARTFEQSIFFRALARFLEWADRRNPRTFFLSNFLAPWKLVLLYFFFYTLLALASPVPTFNMAAWKAGIALFGFSSLLIAASAYYFGRKPREVKAKGSFGYGLLLIGIIGLLVNYSWIGFPILGAANRAFYHNVGWMVFFNSFIIGLAMVAVRTKKVSEIFALIGLALLLNFPSGFRTDLVVSLAAILVPAWKNRLLSGKKIVALGALLLPIVILVKVVLISSGDLGFIIPARAGFTLYTLENVLLKTPIWGQPRLALNLLLQLIGVRVIQIGAVAGEATVNLPRFYTSTFAGPLWIGFGWLGVLGGSLVFGWLLGRTYSSTSPWGKGFYGLLFGIALIWMETGPLQIYFLGTALLAALLIAAKKL